MRASTIGFPMAIVVAILGSAVLPAAAEQPGEPALLAHPAIADPANISPQRAEEIYQAIRDRMREVYAASGDPVFLEYQSWARYNRLPYRAASHGERFVNHFGNGAARAYSRYEAAGELPVGSIVIKDSFTVTGQGQVMTGPLFMMEKMPPEFSSPAGTWRFLMLAADGSTVGLTGGRNAAAVRFCGECHANAGVAQDYLYFMPADARR